MSSRHRDERKGKRHRSRSPINEKRTHREHRNDRRDGERTETERRSGSKEERKKRSNDKEYGRRNEVNEKSREIKRQRLSENTESIEGSNTNDKEQPNFSLSGKLTEYTNTYKGVVIKYNEPPEALKPKTRWRLYPFKGDKSMPVMYIHRQSAYLIGRQRHIVDLAVDHPSCSKQHAVLQFRLVEYEREDGAMGRKCKPYIIDLESTNGTFLNNQKIEARRFYELKEKDVVKFGFSTREYVLLNEKSKVSEADDISETEET